MALAEITVLLSVDELWDEVSEAELPCRLAAPGRPVTLSVLLDPVVEESSFNRKGLGFIRSGRGLNTPGGASCWSDSVMETTVFSVTSMSTGCDVIGDSLAWISSCTSAGCVYINSINKIPPERQLVVCTITHQVLHL